MMNMMDGCSGWMGGGMMFLAAFFLVLIVAGVILIVKWLLGGKGGGTTPMEILKGRYARGEIDRETFERMRRDIEGGES